MLEGGPATRHAVVLRVEAPVMQEDSIPFFDSQNRVGLMDQVPRRYPAVLGACDGIDGIK